MYGKEGRRGVAKGWVAGGLVLPMGERHSTDQRPSSVPMTVGASSAATWGGC